MFLGLRTVIYRVKDIKKAREWYTLALGVPPYFDEPYYVGFNVGGFELGLDPDQNAFVTGDNVLAYWAVANVEEGLAHLLKAGAKTKSEVQDVGGGIRLATVKDPFGNVFGIIENPNFKAV